MISHRHKCIFIHIPKTGGTSIENVIWPVKSERTEADLWMGLVKPYYNKYQTGGLQHLTAQQIRKEVGEDIFNSYFKFAVVRNPWDKAVSQYTYMQKRKDLRKFIGMNRYTTFRRYLKLIDRKEHVQWKPQLDFLVDTDGTMLVDKIIHFEALEEGFHGVIQHLGMPETDLPHANPSKRKHYQTYYNTKNIRYIEERYAADIAALQYAYE